MDYKKLEQMISSYNELVNTLNSVMDDEIANNDISDAPYEAFELIKTTDDNPNHLPYLYLRFVYLPYHVPVEIPESTKKSKSKSAKKSTKK